MRPYHHFRHIFGPLAAAENRLAPASYLCNVQSFCPGPAPGPSFRAVPTDIALGDQQFLPTADFLVGPTFSVIEATITARST
eukprot:6183009-Pleurochrysis_carterae.AAC.3